jgi:hypothetical protein
LPFPYHIYASWYQRYDDAWTFGGDNNLKIFDFSRGSNPVTDNFYLSYDGGPPNTTATSGYFVLPNNQMTIPDINGQNNYHEENGNYTNPFRGEWSKIEVLVRVTDQTDGFIRLWDQNGLRVYYAGRTDSGSVGDIRSAGIGGYARMYNQPGNWRYFVGGFMDIDANAGRFVLTNSATYSASTIVEPPPYTSWSDTSVILTANLGALSAGVVHLHYRNDATGGHQYLGTRTVA